MMSLANPTSEYSSTHAHKQDLFARTVEQIYLGRRKVATGAAALLAIGLGYHVMFGHNGLTAYEQKRQNSVMLNKDLSTLERENELLKAHVERLQSDPSAIEHQAREELHYTRPGEVIYTLSVKPDGPAPTVPVPPPLAPIN